MAELNRLAEAEAALADFDGKIRGCLLLGGSTIPGTYLLPRVIGGFIRRYPEVKTTLKVGDTADIIADIAAQCSARKMISASVVLMPGTLESSSIPACLTPWIPPK